jgi:ABC-type cobalamin/Fe3+-siderophores transport system ATPase subunit
MTTSKHALVGIVGPCGSGKSTLKSGLERLGYQVRHIAQEHSYVGDMWKRITNPDILVFLDASFPVATARRKLTWREADYIEQQRRLAHARQHADLYLFTDGLGIEEVVARVAGFLEELSGAK